MIKYELNMHDFVDLAAALKLLASHYKQADLNRDAIRCEDLREKIQTADTGWLEKGDDIPF